MYYCYGQGYVTGLSGQRYKITPGKTLDAPNGELYARNGVEWIGDESEKKPEPIEPSVEIVIPDNMAS